MATYTKTHSPGRGIHCSAVKPSGLQPLRMGSALIGLIIAFSSGSQLLYAEETVDPPANDVRVLIDVSGSMKQTDPQNLRVAALKLINGLIPNGSRAGVWTFGRYVDMTVKWGKVDDAWRKQADLGADKIHSNALLTNIESALARARVGWEKPDAKTRRILLLLTDGKVDVSSDPIKNEKSRAKVLTESLSSFKSAAAQIHTIALRQNNPPVKPNWTSRPRRVNAGRFIWT